MFIQGGTAFFTLTVSNQAGTSPTSGTVTVTDTFPAGVTPTAASGAGWGVCTITGQAVSCPNTTILAPGSSYSPITVNVNVASNATSNVNTGVVSCACDPTSPHNGSAPYTVNSPPVLSIVKTASNGGVFTQGGTAFFTLTVSNQAGTSPTSGTVTVTDTLPAGLTPISASGAGWGACTITGQIVSCPNTNALAGGSSYSPITVNVNVTPNATSNINPATVSCACDPTGPHTGTAPYTVSSMPNLLLTKTFNGTAIQGGSEAMCLP